MHVASWPDIAVAVVLALVLSPTSVEGVAPEQTASAAWEAFTRRSATQDRRSDASLAPLSAWPSAQVTLPCERGRPHAHAAASGASPIGTAPWSAPIWRSVRASVGPPQPRPTCLQSSAPCPLTRMAAQRTRLAQCSAVDQVSPTSTKASPGAGPELARIGNVPADVDRILPQAGQLWPELGQARPSLGRLR